MQAKVFHARLTADGHAYHPRMEGPWPLDDEHYTLVATVELSQGMTEYEMLASAFERTNHIDQAWWHNEGVVFHGAGKGARSTSVGDIVQIGNKAFRVESLGWSPVEVP